MSMKTKLQTNNTDLQSILNTINALPEEMMDAYAVINVTYPEGSVCTCSNENRTLELDNTLGYGFFLVDEGGEWTVSCTDDTKTASQTVEITTEGQWKSVELRYALVLFDGENGGDNVAVTGGWLTFHKYDASVNITAEKITMDGDAGYEAAVATENAIDLSKYSTLFMRYKINSARGNASDKLMFGVATSNGNILTASPSFAASESLSFEATNDVVIASCDISSVDTGVVGVNAKYEYNIDIFEIWLEVKST